MRTFRSTTLLALALCTTFGCVDDDSDPQIEARAAESAFDPGPARLPASATASTPTLAAPELPSPPSAGPAAIAGQPWRARVTAEVTRVQTDAPAWFDHVMTLEPRRARSGVLRLVGPELEDPSAAPVLLHRYLQAEEAPEVRAAVIAALSRTLADDTDYVGAVTELLASEADPQVRVAMITTLRRAPGPEAIVGLELGLADADPQVRVAAANAAGRHPDGSQLAAPLIAALDDLPEVQLAASRSLGYLHVESATTTLTGLLASDDAQLRLSALQAIDRIDPAVAEGLAQLSVLVTDADPKVARAAEKIAAR
jgi:hypothetical protein